ncbi:MAG: CocE/NonD family hydrolase [Bacteroidetes bacterium]|nr:CocE/NonD family hydrolase [Bacteroidota bacterium]
MKTLYCVLISLFFLTNFLSAQDAGRGNEDSLFIIDNYDKYEYRIPMRDGVTLFTVVYSPKDKNEKYPILFLRTPYSVAPYGEEKMKTSLGPSMKYAREKFIFVYQDVRGRFMSEGKFENVRPYKPNKKNKSETDETTDTYDAIDWLIKNVPGNNGKVGMWGISYPGFYASMGLINAHPALVAASPQAPIADWFRDDFFHYGAFFLPHAFNFFYVFGRERHGLFTDWGQRFTFPTKDGYNFYLNELGPLKNINIKYYHDSIPFWNDIINHPDFDYFWRARNILPRLQGVKPSVLVTGGWYDAEDLYGTLKTYQAIEVQNPGTDNHLVMGPWYHGGWGRSDGSKLGNVFFGDSPPPSEFYLDSVEFPFFACRLKGKCNVNLAEAYLFETGTNRWRKFNQWPPVNMVRQNMYLHKGGILDFNEPSEISDSFDEFISDPANPVPYTDSISNVMRKEYMTDDQRFTSNRPDVLSYKTGYLEENVTLAGNMRVTLYVSVTGTDADWIVKLIDLYPDSAANFKHNPPGVKMGGYQQMVRSEVMRGRFRNSLEKPEPFKPGELTKVCFELQDVLHAFKKGHRIMVQVQSAWFPLVDRNPQKYVINIFKADEEDFIKATHRVYYLKDKPSFLEVGVVKP